MRRAEASGLKGRLTDTGEIEGDLDLDNNVAVVMGKGRRVRACPFGARTTQALSATCAPATLTRFSTAKSCGLDGRDP
jgi:site-specific recombinase XerC